MTYELLEAFIPFVAFWCLLCMLIFFGLLRFLPVPDNQKESKDTKKGMILQHAEYASHFTSLFHAIISFAWTLTILLTVGFRDLGNNLSIENHLVYFSLGYFVMDSTLGFIFSYNDKPTHIHHVAVVVALTYVLCKDKYANSIISALCVAECSNPLLLLRKIFMLHKRTAGLVFPIGLVFSLSFIFARLTHKNCGYRAFGLRSPAQ